MKVGRRCYRYLFLEKTLYGHLLIPIFHRLCYYLRGRGSGNLGRAGTVVGDESSGIIHLVLDLCTGQTMPLHPYAKVTTVAVGVRDRLCLASACNYDLSARQLRFFQMKRNL